MKALTIIGIVLLSILGLILFILFLLVLLLLFRVKLNIVWNESEKLIKLKYLFFDVQLYPSKKKKEEKKDTEKKKDKKKKEKKDEKPNGFTEFFNHQLKKLEFSDYLDFIAGFKDRFIKTLLFDRLYLNISVATKEPHTTAIRYGQLCAALFPLLGKLHEQKKLKDADVHIVPEFMNEKTKFTTDTVVSLRPIAMISWLLGVFIKIMRKK